MPSFRQAYFKALELGVPKGVIYFALQEVSGKSYFEIVEHFDDELENNAFFEEAMKRYLDGEMIEYIFSKAVFLSLPFYINKNVLIPRQETEQLVLSSLSMINEMFGDKKINIADVCTGSGVIGLSIANRLPNNNYFLTDISKEAIRVAKKNASQLCLKVKFFEGNMVEPLIENRIKLDVLLCNPPYIENIETIDERTWKQEPHLALLANPSTKFYEEILRNVPALMNDKYLLGFEIGEDMEEKLVPIISKYCPDAQYRFEKDIYDKVRFLFIKQD